MGQMHSGKPDSPQITYATKLWEGEWREVLRRHPDADLYIGNNLEPETSKSLDFILRDKFVDIGPTEKPYYYPELEAVWLSKTPYLLWYAGDVTPPPLEWVDTGLKLLGSYPIVTVFWENNFEDYCRMAEKSESFGFGRTDFGFEDSLFSDQCYLAKTETMRQIDYEAKHPVGDLYPRHGGDSFEKRVAQWLAATGQKRAVLKDFIYRHIPAGDKP